MIRPELPYYDLVLVNTPAKDYAKVDRLSDSLISPLGLGSIATYCSVNGYKAGILDAYLLRMPVSQVINYLQDLPAEYIGLNATSENIRIAIDIAEKLRTKVIIGGTHASLCPEEILSNYDCFDAVIIGEGEYPVNEILKGKPFSDINGIAFKRNGSIINNPRIIFPNLNELPIINRTFFEPTEKFHLITSRGCPHNCAFCASPLLCGRIVRFEPMEKVMKEIAIAYANGSRYFHFLDDQFLINSARAKSFLTMLKQISLFGKIQWRGMARVDTILSINNGTIEELRESGGDILAMGIESGSQRIIKMIHKKTDNGMVKKTIQKLVNLGWRVKGFFVLGFPTETYSEMIETKQLIMELGEIGMEYFNLAVFHPYPGTELYYRLLGEGYSPKQIFYEQDVEEEELPDKYLHGYYNRLNEKIQISNVPNWKIRDLIRQTIMEFKERFGKS